jgi:methylenetetrahydrofolate dehydrogenase (NADP+)/methenyltetrahydrofolate cyclohydrolase
MDIVDGRKIATGVLARFREQPRQNRFLAAVLVGDDKSSVSFLTQKERTAKELGVDFRIYRFPADIKNDDLRREVGKIVAHKTCGGAIVQLPLPDHLNPHYILNVIPPEKDIDVLGERTLGAFSVGRSRVLPPAVGTVEEIISNVRSSMEVEPWKLENRSVAVVGLGLLVGRPIANWIMRRAKQTILLRSTSDLALLRGADIVITGVGKAGCIVPKMLADGAGVIDFGYGTLNGKYSGDLDTRDLAVSNRSPIAWYTPTPGGTGPILVAKLFENFYRLNAGPQDRAAISG